MRANARYEPGVAPAVAAARAAAHGRVRTGAVATGLERARARTAVSVVRVSVVALLPGVEPAVSAARKRAVAAALARAAALRAAVALFACARERVGHAVSATRQRAVGAARAGLHRVLRARVALFSLIEATITAARQRAVAAAAAGAAAECAVIALLSLVDCAVSAHGRVRAQ
jgi:hypothetical protein